MDNWDEQKEHLVDGALFMIMQWRHFLWLIKTDISNKRLKNRLFPAENHSNLLFKHFQWWTYFIISPSSSLDLKKISIAFVLFMTSWSRHHYRVAAF